MERLIQTIKRRRVVRHTCLSEAQSVHYRQIFGVADAFYDSLSRGQRNIVVTAMLLVLFLRAESFEGPPELMNCVRDVVQTLRDALPEATREIIRRVRDDLHEMVLYC